MANRNRDKLFGQNIYDLLIKMQKELEYAREHGETPCIMHLLCENLVGLRCIRHNGKCSECIATWLNEEAA